MRELLRDVRQGDLGARSQLYQSLKQDNRVNRTIRSLTYKHSCIESDDIKAEFWHGVIKGMNVIRSDIGDPILHLIKRGIWQVKSVVRQELNKKIVQYCSNCGGINGSYSFAKICQKCGNHVDNMGRYIAIDEHDFQKEDHEFYKVTIIHVTKSITKSQQSVLEIIVQCCVDGVEHPRTQCSRILGISKERVRQQLEKIKPYLVLDANDGF